MRKQTIDKSKITLDDIVDGIIAKNISFDAEKIDAMYHEMYPNELQQYALVKPYEVISQISVGSIIRYNKKKTNGISCASFVVKIVYTTDDISVQYGSVLDYLLLGRLPRVWKHDQRKKKLWRIYPSNHHIFKFDDAILNQENKKKMLHYYKKYSSNVKMISIPAKERNKILKHMGATDEEIEKDNELEKQLREIFDSKNKKKPSYSNISIDTDNSDD